MSRKVAPIDTTHDVVNALIGCLQDGLVKGDLPEAAFHAVVIPDSGEPLDFECATGEELAECLRFYEGQDVHVRAFYGRKCGVTKRPRYLVTHEGRYPLFSEVDGDEVDPSGYLGKAKAADDLPAGNPALADEDPDDDDDQDAEAGDWDAEEI